MVRKLVVVFTSVVLFAAAHAKALGLGEITVESALNQPFTARIELLQLGGVRPEQISVQLASESDFARFSIVRENFLNSIRFNVVAAGNSPYVRLSSLEAVREPYLSFVLETRWPSGRLLSEHTVLLDLPAFSSASAPAVRQPEQSGRSADGVNSSSDQVVTQDISSSFPPTVERLAAQDPVTNAPTDEVVAADDSDSAASPAVVAAPAPEPVPSNSATPLAANGDTVTIDGTDTLWNIALEVRPDSSVTVQQTMLALQRINSEAFIADNINMVRRGQVLRIPNLEQIRALSAREAINEVSRQNQLFENRANVPLTSQPVSAQPSAASSGSAGRPELTIVTTDTAEQASAQSTSGGRSAELDAQVSDLEDALAVQQEEADRVSLANDELNERLSMLEQQIDSAQEIIRLRDLELAQLQQSLAAEQAAAVSPGAVEEPAAATATPEPEDPPMIITRAPERSFLQMVIDTLIANTYILLAVTALIILLLVYALLRRNRAAEAAAYAEVGAIADDEGETNVSGVHSEFSSAGSDTAVLDDDEDLQEIFGRARSADVSMFADEDELQELAEESELLEEIIEDAIADEVLSEADALISGRRFDEAVTLLQNAIVAEPERTDLRLKLLEVCVARQDAIGFKLQETELRDLGDATVGPRIAALKAQLRGELVRGDLDHEILEAGEDAFLSELDALEDLEIALDMESSADVDDNKVRAGLSDEFEDDDYDLDEDVEEPEDDEADDDIGFVADEVTEAEADALNENLMDFDFDFAVEEDGTEDRVETVADEQVSVDDPDHSIDFDFAVLDDAEPEGEVGEFTFDSTQFDLDVADEEPENEVKSPFDEALAELDDLQFIADSDEIDLDVEFTEEDAAEEEDFAFVSDTDEVATKLDLAKAYVEMGDQEGAREILEEVLNEGNEAQVADAQDLLDKL